MYIHVYPYFTYASNVCSYYVIYFRQQGVQMDFSTTTTISQSKSCGEEGSSTCMFDEGAPKLISTF